MSERYTRISRRKMQLQGFRLGIEPALPTLDLSYRSRCRELGCEFCIFIQVVMRVKYKGILKIIFGIYIRC